MNSSNAQLISEIRALIQELETKVDELERQIAETAAPEEAVKEAAEPAVIAAATAAVTVAAQATDDSIPAEEAPEPAAAPEDPEPPMELFFAAEPILDFAVEENIPSEAPAEPEQAAEPAPAPQQHRSGRMHGQYSWMQDLAGAPVGNIISAISLNDRVLFINTLFKEDALLFNSTIAAFNAMETLDQVLDYIEDNFPEWNPDTEVIYRLMMAVRRKIAK